MTMDLALILGGDQEFLTTEEFLDAIDENLQRAVKEGDPATSDSTQEAAK
jgi:isocitrate dehydrogenase